MNGSAVKYNGAPMNRAPKYLIPYLDCVDGAFAVGGSLDDGGNVVSTKWALFRGDQEVGVVTIDVRDLP